MIYCKLSLQLRKEKAKGLAILLMWPITSVLQTRTVASPSTLYPSSCPMFFSECISGRLTTAIEIATNILLPCSAFLAT